MIERSEHGMLAFESTDRLGIERITDRRVLHRSEIASHRIGAEVHAPDVAAREPRENPESESFGPRTERLVRPHRFLPELHGQRHLHRASGPLPDGPLGGDPPIRRT